MILNNKESLKNLIDSGNITLCGDGEIVKANIDIVKNVVCIGEAVHADMEQFMRENGSERGDICGINIFIDSLDAPGEMIGIGDIEFSSMINFDVNKKIGDLRAGAFINNETIKNKIVEVLNLWLTQ